MQTTADQILLTLNAEYLAQHSPGFADAITAQINHLTAEPAMAEPLREALIEHAEHIRHSAQAVQP